MAALWDALQRPCANDTVLRFSNTVSQWKVSRGLTLWYALWAVASSIHVTWCARNWIGVCMWRIKGLPQMRNSNVESQETTFWLISCIVPRGYTVRIPALLENVLLVPHKIGVTCLSEKKTLGGSRWTGNARTSFQIEQQPENVRDKTHAQKFLLLLIRNSIDLSFSGESLCNGVF